MEGTKWFMIQKQLSENFDEVFDPQVTKEPLLNPPAQDDRAMKRFFQSWLDKRKKSGNKKPFYAQFYYFNAHYPFFDNKNRTTSTTSRPDGMLQTVDESIEMIFTTLNDTDNLKNTMVFGSGDHGENYSGNKRTKYKRIKFWNTDIFHVPMYMHMPKNILETITDEKYDNLRHNTHQLTSILDIFPTVMHVLEGDSRNSHKLSSESHCLRGLDLFENRINSSRVAWSWPGTSKDYMTTEEGSMALHKGTSSTLHRRFGNAKKRTLFAVEQYADIVESKSVKSREEKKVFEMKEWKEIVKNLLSTDEGAFLRKKAAYSSEFLRVLNLTVPEEKRSQFQ